MKAPLAAFREVVLRGRPGRRGTPHRLHRAVPLVPSRWSLITYFVLWPWSATLAPDARLSAFVAPEMFRVLGLGLLVPNLSPGMPAEFAISTAIGELANRSSCSLRLSGPAPRLERGSGSRMGVHASRFARPPHCFSACCVYRGHLAHGSTVVRARLRRPASRRLPRDMHRPAGSTRQHVACGLSRTAHSSGSASFGSGSRTRSMQRASCAAPSNETRKWCLPGPTESSWYACAWPRPGRPWARPGSGTASWRTRLTTRPSSSTRRT